METIADTNSLPQQFNKAEEHFQHLEDGATPSTEANVLDVIQQFERATKFVSILGLFSRNESVDEISTLDLRYLLLPAYLAKLNYKLQDHRLERLLTVEIYIRDFFRRCRDYEVPGHMAIPGSSLVEPASAETEESAEPVPPKGQQEFMVDAANKRAAKIAALKQKTESREKAAQFRRVIDAGSTDDDVQRGYYFNVINTWILDLIEELDFVIEEKRMLQHRARLEKTGELESPLPADPKKPCKFGKPIVIVKNELQKLVFGAGYPSLPLLTVDEFYKELVEEGALPAPGSKSAASLNYSGPSEAQEILYEIEQEQKIEQDDPQHLVDSRAYAEWKDDHPRGWGNRIGKG